jgi:hypothetical protein
MAMRSKVILIRGFWNLAPEITVASFERINADQVGLMTVLRYPQYMPEPLDEFQIHPVIDFFQGDILQHLRSQGHEHCLLSQYGEIATETGLSSIRAVEGNILRTDWFYEAVKTYHKSVGQSVCVCNLEYHYKDHAVVADIDGVKFFKREDVIERLGHSDILD